MNGSALQLPTVVAPTLAADQISRIRAKLGSSRNETGNKTCSLIKRKQRKLSIKNKREKSTTTNCWKTHAVKKNRLQETFSVSVGVARHSGSQTLAWQTHFQAVSRDAPLKTANDIIREREREWNFLLNDIGWLNLLLVACRRLAEETFLQRSFMKMQIPSADTWQLQHTAWAAAAAEAQPEFKPSACRLSLHWLPACLQVSSIFRSHLARATPPPQTTRQRSGTTISSVCRVLHACSYFKAFFAYAFFFKI